VELFSIYLNRVGSQLEFRFDLPTFPEDPPTSWHKDFNNLQIQLSFWRVREFEDEGWQTELKVKIEVKRRDEILEIVIFNREIDLRYEFTNEFLRIE
jgi:hypothetical protein